MPSEVAAPLLAAFAITRAQLDGRPMRDAIETTLLETSLSDDPIAVVQSLAILASQTLTIAAVTQGVDAGHLLDVFEQGVREGDQR